jgi:predicted Zn-dependent protease with MMP-like domain
MENFDKLINDAILEIPIKIRKKIENVVICSEKKPNNEQLKKIGIRHKNNLLGLYEGVPKKVWGRGFGNNLPDKITLFQDNIINSASTEEEIKKIITDVVWHEIAHHFGFDEKEVQIMEKNKKQ